ncbi:hypothetical protein [uncultured Thiodictyon sp.]|uniref:hypothetical protein n=1 Tax=uncultured Thiodictyon sp. TaxID=1846217 RepID=UPI0025FB0E4C|nr:hypothetical protein [uncultured Thiodictyon sp.]
MIALDTNILARFYVDDPGDSEAVKQRPIAYEIITKLSNLFVPLTVILELEKVMVPGAEPESTKPGPFQ